MSRADGSKSALPAKDPPLAESVTRTFASRTSSRWRRRRSAGRREKGQMLPLLFEPAVLTRITYPTNALKLVQAPAGSQARAAIARPEERRVRHRSCNTSCRSPRRDAESGFVLPVPYGLDQRTQPHRRQSRRGRALAAGGLRPARIAGSNTVATLVLSPVNDAWIAWKPRSRDVKREKPVFYAEISQLYVPAAGVIEGAHLRRHPAGAGRTERTDSRRARAARPSPM